jgi:hypothetical protein
MAMAPLHSTPLHSTPLGELSDHSNNMIPQIQQVIAKPSLADRRLDLVLLFDSLGLRHMLTADWAHEWNTTQGNIVFLP